MYSEIQYKEKGAQLRCAPHPNTSARIANRDTRDLATGNYPSFDHLRLPRDWAFGNWVRVVDPLLVALLESLRFDQALFPPCQFFHLNASPVDVNTNNRRIIKMVSANSSKINLPLGLLTSDLYTSRGMSMCEDPFRKYTSIRKMLTFIKEKEIPSMSFDHTVKTEVEISQAGFCEFFHFKITPLMDSEGMAKIWVIIINDGLEHLAYHAQDFSPNELQAINDACEIEAALRNLF